MADIKTNPDELGALWLKESGRGVYMTGTINGVAVVVFRNDKKQAGSKQPDWRVLKAKPRAAAESRTASLYRADDNIPF